MTRSINADTQPVRLADDQFDKLVELLTPGYQLALTYQAQMQAAADKAAAEAAEHHEKGHKKKG